MEKKQNTFTKVSKYIGFYSLIYGIILLIFSILGIFGVYFSITTMGFFPHSDILVSQLILIISCIISGSLLIITHYGITKLKIYARFTGISGCLLILVILITELIIWRAFTFDSLLTAMIIVILPSVILIVLITVFWNKIPSYNKIQVTQKIKKIIAVMVFGIILVVVLFIVIPDIQKHFALDSLKYADYESGWGFNPPEEWQIENDSYWAFFSPPSKDNVSEDVFLSIFVGSTSSDIDEIGQNQLEDFETEFWINQTVNFSLISHGKKLINGMDSYEFVFTFEPMYKNVIIGPEMKINRIFVIKNNKVLSVDYQSPSIYYDKYESDIIQSLNSITIV
ncbi:MAG: hypothetical protein KAW45_09355 [Thermoplasmatales archaeon]|nr:hypothetical protein [Thermoplasmatales archaeon]